MKTLNPQRCMGLTTLNPLTGRWGGRPTSKERYDTPKGKYRSLYLKKDGQLG